MALSPGGMLSHYRLVEMIGEGGMGVVYRVHDTRLERDVALKVLPAGVLTDESARKRFRKEALALSKLNHPNIATVYDFDTQDGVDFLVMEFIAGTTLDKKLAAGPLLEKEVMRLGSQLVEGLTAAHDHGVLHRDLKPGNLLVTPDGRLKILDFGLAKLLRPVEERSQAETATETRGVVGTPPYMAPEQLRGETVDARTDIWALGVVLYEMAGGQRPFRGETPTKLSDAILHQIPVTPRASNPNISPNLERIVLKCLDKEPENRYQSAKEIAVDLRRLGATGEVVIPRSAPPRSRRWLPRTATVVLTLAGLGVAAWMIRSLLPVQADPRTVLILPMEMRGESEGAEYAGRAFAEALAVDLARSTELTILPVPAAGEVGSSGALARVDAAVHAGAGRLVTGALTREGRALYASLSLVDTTRNRVVWGVRRDAEGDSLASLASSLAGDVASQLGATRPKQYEFFLYLTGMPTLAASPVWTEALGALRRFDVEAALEATRSLIDAFPAEADARVLRCAALLLGTLGLESASPQFQEFEESLAALDRADPNNPWDEVLHGFASLQRGRTREAIEAFTGVLARTDLTPAARGNVLSFRGEARSVIGKFDAAFADFEEALRLDPANDITYGMLGASLLRAGRFEEGLARARQAVALSPTSAPPNSVLGLALQLLSRYEQALVPLKKSCEGSRVFCVGYGSALSLAGHTGEALTLLSEGCESDRSWCADYALALARAGRWKEARSAAGKTADLPETADTLYFQARFQALAGNPLEALGLLRRSVRLGLTHRWIQQDPDLRSLRSDREFEAIVADINRRIGTE